MIQVHFQSDDEGEVRRDVSPADVSSLILALYLRVEVYFNYLQRILERYMD